MTENRPDLERVVQLVRLVETHGLTELIVEEAGCRYEVYGTGEASGSEADDALAADGVGDDRADQETETHPRDSWIPVVAPMVGVFFRSPSPDQVAYVEVGDHVERGQVIGLIEAMKVFSEVPSDHEGIVAEVAAQNGQLLRVGEPIIYLVAP